MIPEGLGDSNQAARAMAWLYYRAQREIAQIGIREATTGHARVSRVAMRPSITAIAFVSVLAMACETKTRGGGETPDGGEIGEIVADCNPDNDRDGDGIADDLEGDADTDNDGTPNDRDLDSDGDGVADSDEAPSDHRCRLLDHDEDGVADWLDTDADNDGLSDGEEAELGTDPTDIDTDEDGVTDLGEVRGTETDPLDPNSTIAPNDFFVVLPHLDPTVQRPLRFSTRISTADIYFLIDTTSSMSAPIANVQGALTSLAARISEDIPNAQLGVGQFRDFPFANGIFDINGYGMPSDMAYRNEQDITDDIAMVQAGLNRLSAAGGMDNPESHVEALLQTATGMGGSWMFEPTGATHEIEPRTCPEADDDNGARWGYPCFRPGALPIVVMVTDVGMHNGPDMAFPYTRISPPPAEFDTAMQRMVERGMRFIGVSVNGDGRVEMEEVGRQTRTVDANDEPLLYTGANVSEQILQGIADLTGGVAQDVTTDLRNVEGNPDDFDATRFIKAIVPVEGYSEGVAGEGYESKDERTFHNVIPGTEVEFLVDFFNDVRPPAERAEIFEAIIIVTGNRVAELDARKVYIVVPPDGHTILI